MTYLFLFLGIAAGLGGVFLLGHAKGAFSVQKDDAVARVKAEDRIAKVDTQAALQMREEIQVHLDEQKDRLAQGAGEKPFDQKAALQLLADADVVVR